MARRALVYTCFFLSGASSLVYEIVWMRQLLLTFGTTTLAVSTVLAAFMVGLALGAYCAGPLADRGQRPLALYGYLEAAIGAYALLLPTLMAWASALYVTAARGALEQEAVLTALRLGLSFLLLVVPTSLMGATLPVLVRFVASSETRFGQELGILYGVNVAGAVAGSALTGFVLIRMLGVQGSTMFAVTLNLTIALLALLARSRTALAPKDEITALRVAAGAAPAARSALWAIVFLSGFLTLGYEVLWTRILVFSFGSTVYSFTIILCTFLAGLTLGSWIFAALVARGKGSASLLATAQVLAGLSVLVLVPVSARAHDLMNRVSDALGYTGSVQLLATALSCVAVMLVPTTLMGIVFPLASRLLVDDLGFAGRRVGTAYLVNTLGAVLGSLLTGFALIPLLALKNSLLLLAGLQVAAAWTVLERRQRWPVAVASSLLVALCSAGLARLLPGPNPFDSGPGSAGARGVLEAHHDGVAGSVSVVRYPQGVRSLRIDGFEAAGDAEGHYSYMAMMTHIPLLVHPDPRRLLVISFGTGTTAGTGLLYPGVRVDAVDINRTVLQMAGHFREVNHDVARSERARLLANDGRNYLLLSQERYDVITSEPMPPTFAGMVNLYSREYYELARRRLEPGGLLVQWLPFHLLRIDESLAILRTVQDVFPETSLWVHRKTGIIVARREPPLRISLSSLRRQLQARTVVQDLIQRGIPNEAELINLYALGPAAIRRLSARASLITDDRPSLEFHVPRHARVRALGTARGDEGLALEVVYRTKRDETLPLEGAAAEEAATLERFHRLSTYDLLGVLYLVTGFLPEARAEFEAGLQRATGAADRALFLLDLALLSRESGQLEQARRFVDETLALLPAHEPALRLRALIDGGRR